MRTRSVRLLAVLAGLAAVFGATVQGSALAEGLAGITCILLALLLVQLDGLRKRGGTRR